MANYKLSFSKRSRVIIIIAVAIAAVLTAGFAVSKVITGNRAGELLTLHETPQHYILAYGEEFGTMPTVTLYESGEAMLSQPPISSVAPVGRERYKVSDDKLTVSGDDTEVVFTISDGGDTLTIQSAKFPFTDVGAVYKYLPGSYLEEYGTNGYIPLSLDELRDKLGIQKDSE